jgi:HK97 family phage portal protein
VIVQSFGQLQAVKPSVQAFPTAPGYTLDSSWFEEEDDSFGEIYATQPNVRICVDFLARNIAQLNIHAYRRVSDTDRERLVDHDVIKWLSHPNPSTSMYRLIEDLMGDMGIYFNAYWLKIRYQGEDGVTAIGLVRLPPAEVTVVGGLLPTAFIWERNSRKVEFPPSEIVHFDGYNPLNPLKGLSPLVTLAGMLREEAASIAHREAYWKNAARHEGIIERPREAPKWTPLQKQAWREQWQGRYAGPANAGMVPVLEDGMTFKATVFSARDSQYTEGGKLRREIVAAQYHIPLPLVGILEHATFSNIKEQHKQLYQDSLGPWLKMIEEELARQLLVESADDEDVYLEFNIAEKLKGSFEEQASGLQMSVGRPIMTPNEGRARLNLPSIKDDPTADQLAPQQGGPSDATANPQNPDEPTATDRAREAEPAKVTGNASLGTVLQATRARQRARLLKFPAPERSTVFLQDVDRWNRELVRDLTPLVGFDEAQRIALQHNLDFFTELDT